MRISRRKWYERLDYSPRKGQQALLTAIDEGYRYLSLFAFPRAGKSWGAARAVEPDLLNHDVHCWLVAPTYELGSKEFGYMWNDYLELGILQMASSKHFDKRGGNMRIEWPWGSFVHVISADNPTALRAEELDWLILCEASALGPDIFYNHLFARIEKRRGKVLVPTTPKGYNWVHETFRVPSLPDGHKELEGARNPKYDPAYWSAVVSAVPEYGDILETGIYDDETVTRARRIMPLPLFKEQFGGDFASYAGNIYPYAPNMEVPPFDIPNEWTHIIGYDHGARDENPTAIMFGSYDPAGNLYWWDEIYLGNRTAKQYASMIRAKLQGKMWSVFSTDPSAKQVRIELADVEIGIYSVCPEQKDIESGIIRMTQLIREGRMKVLRGRCPNLIREWKSWEWDEKNPGKPKKGQPCHALDACRYAVLVPVSRPEGRESDPLAPSNEDQRTQNMWKGLRKKFKAQESRKEYDELTDELVENPFKETLTVESYDFGEGIF